MKKLEGSSRLPGKVKPCLMNMLNGSSLGLIGQGTNAFIVACELRLVGKSNKQIESILTKQNIRPSKIRDIIKSVSKNIYNYRCPKLEELGLCLYESRFECRWFEKKTSQREGKERDFWRYEWPKRLRRTEEALYLVLRSIEMKKGYQAGSRLFVTWDQLHEVSRITRCTIGKKLKILRKIGLIKYKLGKKRLKGSKAIATEIWRIIPIPKP